MEEETGDGRMGLKKRTMGTELQGPTSESKEPRAVEDWSWHSGLTMTWQDGATVGEAGLMI